MRRMAWLYAIGDRPMGTKDRICSVHFRRGRPSFDASHEDFAPHLYLNEEPPQEVVDYLNKLSEPTNESPTPLPTLGGGGERKQAGVTGAGRPSILQRKRVAAVGGTSAASTEPTSEATPTKAPHPTQTKPGQHGVTTSESTKSAPTTAAASSQQEEDGTDRKEGNEKNDVVESRQQESPKKAGKRLLLLPIDQEVAEAAGLKPGQRVTIIRPKRTISALIIEGGDTAESPSKTAAVPAEAVPVAH